MIVSTRPHPENSRLIVWGAGGHARVVAEIAALAGWQVVGYVDRDPQRRGAVVDPQGRQILMSEAELVQHLQLGGPRPFEALALGFGANVARAEAARLAIGRVTLPVLLHPSAVISADALLSPGSVAMALAVVNPGARVGLAAILNSGCVVEHDCRLGDGVHISPNATLAGSVTVGNHTWVGAGAVVIQNVTLGERVTVGAGSTVLRDVPSHTTVVGSPARPIARHR